MYKTGEHTIQQALINGDYVTKDYYIKNGYHNSMVSETKFVNFSSEYLAVCFRDGTYTILAPIVSINPNLNSLIIGHTKSNTLNQIMVIEGDEHRLNRIIREELARNGNNKLYWEESILVATILQHRNGCYISSADIVVIAASRFTHLQYHPFCHQNIHLMHLNLVDKFNASSDIAVSIRAIDVKGLYPNNLYIIFNNKICHLKVRRESNTLADGVYITGMPTILTTTSNDIRVDQVHTFESLLEGNGPILLFLSMAEARLKLTELQDIKQLMVEKNAHEALVLALKRETELLQNETNIFKLDQLRKKDEHLDRDTERLRILQEEKIQLERAYSREKEAYEIEKNKYKLQAEGLKVGGVILTVCFAVFKLLF